MEESRHNEELSEVAAIIEIFDSLILLCVKLPMKSNSYKNAHFVETRFSTLPERSLATSNKYLIYSYSYK